MPTIHSDTPVQRARLNRGEITASVEEKSSLLRPTLWAVKNSFNGLKCWPGNYWGQSEVDTELCEILTQGGSLHRESESLNASTDKTPVPVAWKGSNLKRWLLGLGLLGGTGGAAYAGYGLYNARNAATRTAENSLQPSLVDTALKHGITHQVLSDSLGHHELHHDNPTDNKRHRRRHLHTSLEDTRGSAQNHSGCLNNSENSLEQANCNVKTLLFNEGLLEPDNIVIKEKLLFGVAKFLYPNGDMPELLENNTKILAQKILSASGMYGGNENEQLSDEQAKSVVRHWVFQNIIRSDPEKYIHRKMNEDRRSYTVNDIHRRLPMDRLPTNLNFAPEVLNIYEDMYLSTMWHTLLMEEMPFLYFSAQRVWDMPLSSFDFANLHTGSRFLKNAKIQYFTYDEAMLTGDKMWELALSEGITEDKLGYYLAPAFFFHAANSSGDLKKEQMNDYEVVNRYLQYRREVSEVQKDINQKYNNYLLATKAWLTKGNLADAIISQCPTLSPGLPDQADAIRTPAQKREKAERFAKQNYLNGSTKPCNSAPDNLAAEYSKQTTAVADSFRELDKYLILSAVGALAEDELAFITSSKATIFPVSLTMKTNRPTYSAYGVPYDNNINVSLKNTDLFCVKQGNEERIYALKGIKGGEEGYNTIRVDRDIQKYIQGGMLDYDFVNKKYTLRSSSLESGGDTFSYSFSIDRKRIAAGNENVEKLIDSLSNRHRDALYKALHDSGNDKSDFQKTWAIVKHVIPFYDCIEGIVKNDPMQAVPACLLDAVGLIPVFGQAASLSGKFGMGLARGLRSGAITLGKQGVKAAGKNALREISLPTTVELASLGKNALRSVDPGFGMMTSISKKFANKIAIALQRDKKTADLARNIISSSETGKILQSTIANPVMVTLPETQRLVPAIKYAAKEGRDTYILINNETGEKFGKPFFRDVKGGMLEIKPANGNYGGMHVGEVIPADLQRDVEAFREYIKQLKEVQCAKPAARSKRQINCGPLSLSAQALDQVLEYATVDELTVLAQNKQYRDAIFKTVNNALVKHPEKADKLVEAILRVAEQNEDVNLLSTIALAESGTNIDNALTRYQKNFVKVHNMPIESPQVLGIHDFDGYNPDPRIASQPVHLSYTAFDTDEFGHSRLNIVTHGEPGGVYINGNVRYSADELYDHLSSAGIFQQPFDTIRMLVCHSADNAFDGGISVAQRLAEITRKPVEGFKGVMGMYEIYTPGSYIIPAPQMINDAYLRGANSVPDTGTPEAAEARAKAGALAATEFMHRNKNYISIGVHPRPVGLQNNPVSFIPGELLLPQGN